MTEQDRAHDRAHDREQPGHDPSSEERAEHPGSGHPTAGEDHLDADDRAEALEEMPAGNATEGDTVDSAELDSRAHGGPGEGPRP